MNKKLIAVAVAGALAAPAIALAQTSTVNVYGKVTMELGYADQGNGRPDTDMFQTPGGGNVGFRGEEKLGGGLSAWFQCESSADVRGIGQAGFCGRNSAIGLKGGWGNLHFGRWDTPFKRSMVGRPGTGDTGLFGASPTFSGFSTGNIAAGGGIDLDRNVWRRREAGLIYYESPKFSGFQVLGALSTANATGALDATTGAKPRVVSIAGTYVNGPLAIGLGYERHSEFGGAAGGGDDRGWTVGASYTFMGKVKLGAQYLDTKYETSPVAEVKKRNWQIGVDWNIAGPHSLLGAYVNAGDSKGTLGATLTGKVVGNGALAPVGPSTGADWWTIAYRYAFSKRTNVKFGYIRLDNDSNAIYSLGGLKTIAAGSPQMGTTQSAWAMYAEHKF